jgi:hypothetical protein
LVAATVQPQLFSRPHRSTGIRPTAAPNGAGTMASSDDNNDRDDAIEDFVDTITRVLSHTVYEPVLLKKGRKISRSSPCQHIQQRR